MLSMYYNAIEPTEVRPLIACEAGHAFWQQAGERRRRALSLQLALPPVATRNGLACLLLESFIFAHRLAGRAPIFNDLQGDQQIAPRPLARLTLFDELETNAGVHLRFG